MTEPYFIVTEEELNQIKNDCAYPEKSYCEGCKYHGTNDEDLPCKFKGANALMDEVITRTLSAELEKTRIATMMECRNIVGNKVIFDKCDEMCENCFLCDNTGGCIQSEKYLQNCEATHDTT